VGIVVAVVFAVDTVGVLAVAVGTLGVDAVGVLAIGVAVVLVAATVLAGGSAETSAAVSGCRSRSDAIPRPSASTSAAAKRIPSWVAR
jgi:hypothetical protein